LLLHGHVLAQVRVGWQHVLLLLMQLLMPLLQLLNFLNLLRSLLVLVRGRGGGLVRRLRGAEVARGAMERQPAGCRSSIAARPRNPSARPP
jgi:hypothetical protein